MHLGFPSSFLSSRLVGVYVCSLLLIFLLKEISSALNKHFESPFAVKSVSEKNFAVNSASEQHFAFYPLTTMSVFTIQGDNMIIVFHTVMFHIVVAIISYTYVKTICHESFKQSSHYTSQCVLSV